MAHWEIFVFFFIIAIIYASVGFGGGSSYIAILALYGLPFKEIRLIALCCNIIVVVGGVALYIMHGYVNWKKILPLICISIPCAFAGAMVKLSETNFYLVLSVVLIISAILLWIMTIKKHVEIRQAKDLPIINGSIGGAVGFISGLAGIGGGIFLSPLLHILRWDAAKRIAATASVFILVNSLAGLAGQFSQLHGEIEWKLLICLSIAVFLGGQLGSRLGTFKFNAVMITRLTAILVFIAGVEILIKHLPTRLL